MVFIVWHLLKHQQNLFFYLVRDFYVSCLKTMYPCVDLLGAHGIEYLAELLYVAFGIFLLFHSFETVEFLIVEIEVAVVVSLGAVCVLSAAYPVLAVVVVVLLFGSSRRVAVEPAQEIHTHCKEYKDDGKYYSVRHFCNLF